MNSTLPILNPSRALWFSGFFSLLLSLCSSAFTEEEGSSSRSRPNFLIIMADDCTYNDLALYGGQNAKTPNIDRLAT
ncbi:MAG: hypothetical protein VYB34_07280, partial [Planctomycetota bacterium]|nr:hypothetical protein [Planctomycetota bacterium]